MTPGLPSRVNSALSRRSAMGMSLLAALVILLLALGTTSAQDSGTEDQDPLWSADMLVVEYTSVSIGASSADVFSNIGGSGNLQIKSLWSHLPSRDLRLEFEEGVPGAADLTLVVGDLSLEFSEWSSGERSFKWTEVDVNWEDGQTISVRIIPTESVVVPQPNTPATGAPTISGTAQAGQTLIANTSGIDDQDGLTNPAYSYQWLADDVEIQDATDSMYALTDDEVGSTIRVRVSFTDDSNNRETLTSAATDTVAPRPPLTATFAASPFQSARHKGTDDRPQVIVAFSRPVSSFTKTTPSVAITGGAVHNVIAHSEEGLQNAWLFFLDPDGDTDLQFTLLAGQACDQGGICVADGTTLFSVPATRTIPGPEE